MNERVAEISICPKIGFRSEQRGSTAEFNYLHLAKVAARRNHSPKSLRPQLDGVHVSLGGVFSGSGSHFSIEAGNTVREFIEDHALHKTAQTATIIT